MKNAQLEGFQCLVCCKLQRVDSHMPQESYLPWTFTHQQIPASHMSSHQKCEETSCKTEADSIYSGLHRSADRCQKQASEQLRLWRSGVWSSCEVFDRCTWVFAGAGPAWLTEAVVRVGTAALWLDDRPLEEPLTPACLYSPITAAAHVCVCHRNMGGIQPKLDHTATETHKLQTTRNLQRSKSSKSILVRNSTPFWGKHCSCCLY